MFQAWTELNPKSRFRWGRATPVRIAGVILVAVSMFLEAFSDMRGYQCALMTLTFCVRVPFELIPKHLSIVAYAKQLRDGAFGIFLGASGLINPLLLLYLFFKPTRRLPVLVLFGFLLAEAVCVFALFRTLPSVGFYVWFAGIVLIVAPQYERPEQASYRPLLSRGVEEPASRA